MIEQTVDLYIEVYKQLKGLVPPEQRDNATELFQRGCEIHKETFGSLKFTKGDAYYQKMRERYYFGRDYALTRLGLEKVFEVKIE